MLKSKIGAVQQKELDFGFQRPYHSFCAAQHFWCSSIEQTDVALISMKPQNFLGV
jgi:hypothetical protein